MQTLLLFGLSAVALLANNRAFISPSFLFSIGFAASSLCAWIYSTRWELQYQLPTFLIVVGGNTLFLVVAEGTRLLSSRLSYPSPDNATSNMPNESRADSVSDVGLIIFCIVVMITALFFVDEILNLYPDRTFFEAMRDYDWELKHTEQGVSINKWLSRANNCIAYGSYYIVFIAAKTCLILTGKKRPESTSVTRRSFLIRLVALLCTFIYAFLTGRRGGLVGYAIAFLISYCVLYFRREKKQFMPSRAIALALMVLVVVFMILFRFLAIGRSSETSLNVVDHMALYLGGSIYNLNSFIVNSPIHANTLWGAETFYASYQFLSSKLGIAEWDYMLDHPYLRSAAMATGNVYTTFYAFYYDFGLPGIIVLTTLAAVFAELIYQKALYASGITAIKIFTVFYSFFGFHLLFCFFSNKIYENIICLPLFVKAVYLLCICLLTDKQIRCYLASMSKGAIRRVLSSIKQH